MGSSAAPLLASRARLLFYLARRELARRYAGSLLGAAWAVAFPALQIAVYWAVFRYGLRVETGGAVPLGPMLIAGMVPWLALAEALTTMTPSLKANAALVKRTALPVELLALSSLAAAACVHGAVLFLASAALWALGYAPGADLAFLLYGAFCVAILALSLGILLALAHVAFSDVGQALAGLLLVWLWATPILWQETSLPAEWRWVASVNPLTHPVEIYRLALLGPEVGALNGGAILSFWTAAPVLALAAWLALGRFKREVADLL